MERTFVVFTPGFPADESDSTCLPPQQLFVLALREADPQLNIIVLTFQYPFVSDQYTWKGITVIPFNGRNKGKFNRLAVWLKVILRFRRLQKKQNIVGLISFWCGECGLLGKYLGSFYSIKHHCWILGQDAKKNNKYFSLIQPKADELIAMSEFLQSEFYRNHGVKPSYIVQNGIDEKLFTSNAVARDIDILGVGSLIPLKQYDVFVEIVRGLISKVPAVKAVIIGNGPQKDRLSASILHYGLNANLSLAGEQPHDKVLEMMARAKILVHTSTYEGFSTVCLEALFAGCHVVSFCSPSANLNTHWHVVKTQSEMSQKVYELLKDEQLDNSSQKTYTMIDSAKAVLELY